MTRDYCAVARQYALDVTSGAQIACEWVQLACKRQLRDLKREGTAAFPYFFEPSLGNRICKFIELLPHIKGELANQRQKIRLEPWQIFILTCIFGWITEKGHRRFRTVYHEIARKNAKSTLSAGVGLYGLAADHESGAEVYSAATTRDQAGIVFKDAQTMARKTPGLRARFGVEVSSHELYIKNSNSLFKSLSRDSGGNLDGLNVSMAIIDELHAHKTRDIFDVIETATASRTQPLIWNITTAGFNRLGICYEQRTYLTKILRDIVQDETYFGLIYTLDPEDDWKDPSNWIKSNPNLGVSVDPEDLARKAHKAMTMASAQNNFLTKHLNVWVNADSVWMDLVAWEKNANEGLKLEDFKGQRCIAAVDLATKIDIAPLVLIFPPAEADGDYHLFARYYLPEDAAEAERNQFYAGWAKEGRITLTPGTMTDFSYIEEDICELAKSYQLEEVLFDPWQANYIMTRLQEKGMPVVEYRQTVQNMSGPMKDFEALVLSGRLKHNGCPVMNWMLSNVIAHIDAKENIYPRKEQAQNKIDGPVATIMALGRAMMPETEDDEWVDLSYLDGLSI